VSGGDRPVRIAHLSDTHLGYAYRGFTRTDPVSGRNQRSLDIEAAYEAAISDILTRDVDLVVHAGDVFHHTRPTWHALRCFIRQSRRLEEAGLRYIVIAGNHDTARLRTTGTAFSVLDLALPETMFVTGDEPQTIEFAELNLAALAVPHGAVSGLLPVIPSPREEMRNLLVTHGMVPGLTIQGHHEPGEEVLSMTLLDAAFDYIALGHYHIAGRQGGNAWYSGATERMGWGDELVQPGYLLVTLGSPGDEPSVETVTLATRPMVTLHALSGDGRTARELTDLALDRALTLGKPEAMTRIELRDTPRPVRRETEAMLRRESPGVVWSLQVYAPASILSPATERPERSAMGDLRMLFAAFVAERTGTEYDQDFAAAFLARGERALAEAEDAAEAIAASEDPAA